MYSTVKTSLELQNNYKTASHIWKFKMGNSYVLDRKSFNMLSVQQFEGDVHSRPVFPIETSQSDGGSVSVRQSNRRHSSR